MRIVRFAHGTAVIAMLLYAIYSAFTKEWPRATFFLVLYHATWQIGIWIEEQMSKMRLGGMM
jgi:Ni,Fe-hydrogenase I cytochrome b subunit